MDARERYFWDLTGYLVVRNVLAAEELSECNAAIDHCMERMQQSPDNGGARGESNALQGTGQQTLPNLLELPHPHCEPFRRLLGASPSRLPPQRDVRQGIPARPRPLGLLQPQGDRGPHPTRSGRTP